MANKKYKLSKGDSLYFKSSLKHRFKNASKKEVKALWVVSHQHFRWRKYENRDKNFKSCQADKVIYSSKQMAFKIC